MRLPRDLSGQDLARRLARLGYVFARQRGSHATLIHPGPPEKFITVPMHDSLKPGTLNAILREVAVQMELEREPLLQLLFEK